MSYPSHITRAGRTFQALLAAVDPTQPICITSGYGDKPAGFLIRGRREYLDRLAGKLPDAVDGVAIYYQPLEYDVLLFSREELLASCRKPA